MDILGSLPVELSIRVLKYLTPAESILLRLVSMKYHDLLTSEDVCSSLSHHFIKREENAARKLDSWRLHYENHLSRRLSYGFGKPWLTEVLPQMRCRYFCLETSYLAGVLGAEFVQVLDLNAYPAKCVFPPTRIPDTFQLRDVILLPSFVVVFGESCGCSWNLETHRAYRFEFSSWGESRTDRVRGNGDLIVITLPELLVVYDLRAEKASTFKNICGDTRIWKGEEAACPFRPCPPGAPGVPNEEKRVLWVMKRLQHPSFRDQEPLVVDSVHLETGEVVLGEPRNGMFACGGFYCGDGLWQFWDNKPFSLYLEPAQHTTKAWTEQSFFDTRTGDWTEEVYTILFPGWVTEFPYDVVDSGPMARPDGLGCFISHRPSFHVWMLDREPGEGVTRARPLDPNALVDLVATGNWYHCLGLCDKFILLGSDKVDTVVVRFKGIHDRDG